MNILVIIWVRDCKILLWIRIKVDICFMFGFNVICIILYKNEYLLYICFIYVCKSCNYFFILNICMKGFLIFILFFMEIFVVYVRCNIINI